MDGAPECGEPASKKRRAETVRGRSREWEMGALALPWTAHSCSIPALELRDAWCLAHLNAAGQLLDGGVLQVHELLQVHRNVLDVDAAVLHTGASLSKPEPRTPLEV